MARESEETFNVANKKKASNTLTPASKRDVFLYRQIGINFLCRSRMAEIEFPKAIGISSATFADIITQKHGGLVEELPDQKLSPRQLYLSSEVQVLEGAIKYCPDLIPDDVKKKFNEFIKNEKKNKKSNKK